MGDLGAAARPGAAGHALEAAILTGADMLSGESFAQLAGFAPAELDRRRLGREVLAFDVGSGCIRAPMWQVGGDRSLLPGLPALFDLLGDDPWQVYLFLTTPHPEFDWDAPLHTLRRGVTAPVLAAALIHPLPG